MLQSLISYAEGTYEHWCTTTVPRDFHAGDFLLIRFPSLMMDQGSVFPLDLPVVCYCFGLKLKQSEVFIMNQSVFQKIHCLEKGVVLKF